MNRLAFALGQLLERGAQFRRQVQVQACTTALHGWARMIQRQLQHRLFAAQGLDPIGQLSLALTGFEPVALPDRIVGVLHGQFRQDRGDWPAVSAA